MWPFRNKNNQEALDLNNHPKWIKKIEKVKTKEMFSYLRSLPTHGVEYLLVFNGRVTDRYNLNTNVNAIQLLAGNYLVYAIDMTQKSVRFEFKEVPLASPDISAVVDVDITYMVEDARQLFESNTGELEPEIKRRIERRVRQVCLEYQPNEAIKAQKEIQHAILNTIFDFGVKIVDGLVTIQLPKEVRIENKDKGILEKEIRDFATGELDFEMEMEFANIDDPYRVRVQVFYERNFDDPYAEDKMKRRGMTNPEKLVRSQVEKVIREAFRIQIQRTRVNIDIEEAANDAVNALTFSDLGLRVSYANIAIMETQDVRIDKKRRKLEDEIIDTLQNRGLQGLFIKISANPDLKPVLLELIDNTRKNIEYLQAQNERVEDRTFEKLKKSVEIGVIDPEYLNADTQRALSGYLLGSTNHNMNLTGSTPQLNTNTTASTQTTPPNTTDNTIVPAQKTPSRVNTDSIPLDPKPDTPDEWSNPQPDDGD